jgi:hypothetical protein
MRYLSRQYLPLAGETSRCIAGTLHVYLADPTALRPTRCESSLSPHLRHVCATLLSADGLESAAKMLRQSALSTETILWIGISMPKQLEASRASQKNKMETL